MSTKLPFNLDIIATANTHAAFLRRHLTTAHALLKSPLRELSLALVGDRKMSALHHRFMGISGPTDVLTFEIDYDERGKVIAGEVIVCTSQAARQARRRAAPVRNELLLYALHGMLHLCGMDDKTDGGFAAMHAREDEILTALGVGPVFRPAAKSTSRRHRSGAA